MARLDVTDKTAWTLVTTTTVDTLITIEGGPARLQTEDTTGLELDDGMLIGPYLPVVIPAGLPVSVVPVSRRITVVYQEFGV